MKVLSPLFLTASVCALALIVLGARKKDSADRPPEEMSAHDGPRVKELGLVKWLRGFETARVEALSSNKPLLILFQEVPGCATCVGYGEQVLSHPLIVEAIETEFTPLAVYNNISGDDKKTLDSFDEPSWNNPVVRIVTAEMEELTKRVNGDYSQKGLTAAMVAALRKSGHEIPAYLKLLDEELVSQTRRVDHATFAMSCFWTGEAEFGAVDGVLATKSGFLDGHEVVDVTYDPSVIRYDELVRYANKNSCAIRVFTRNKEQHQAAQLVVGDAARESRESVSPDHEPKYYLAQTLLRFLPMTETQAARVNSAIGKNMNPDVYLSPRQRRLYSLIKDHPKSGWKNSIGVDFTVAWSDAVSLASKLSGRVM